MAEQEQFELGVIDEYTPEALGEEEIADLVKSAIAETGASSMKDMGSLMAILKPKLQGRADMSSVSKLVKQHLS